MRAAKHRIEEQSALHRIIEYLRQADLHLPERELVIETGGPVLGKQGPRKAVGPSVEEVLDVGETE